MRSRVVRAKRAFSVTGLVSVGVLGSIGCRRADAEKPAPVLAKSICMATNEGCSKLIDKGRPLPASHTEAFTNQTDDQTTVGLYLYQGEDIETAKNAALGVFTIPIKTAVTRGAANVQVTVKVSRDRELSIVVQDINTGTSRTIDGGFVQ